MLRAKKLRRKGNEKSELDNISLPFDLKIEKKKKKQQQKSEMETRNAISRNIKC